jgi:hypothetical protein
LLWTLKHYAFSIVKRLFIDLNPKNAFVFMRKQPLEQPLEQNQAVFS